MPRSPTPDTRRPARPAPKRPAGLGARRATRDARSQEPDVAVLYGWHPVAAALANPRRRLVRLLATANAVIRLSDELPELRLEPEIVRTDDISRLLEPDAVHQGLYLEAQPLESPGLDELGDEALLLALDQVTDPHNVGAITRSAAAFGASGIVTTARHSPSATGVLAKAASGGLEHVPFIVVRNLADALIELGSRGFTRIGLDSEGDSTLSEARAARPVVLVLGAEGKGLRQRTRANCDVVARLEMPGAIGSLNVSNAAAIALYALCAGKGPSEP